MADSPVQARLTLADQEVMDLFAGASNAAGEVEFMLTLPTDLRLRPVRLDVYAQAAVGEAHLQRKLTVVAPVTIAPEIAPKSVFAGSRSGGFYLDRAIGQLVEMSLLEVNDALEEKRRRYSVHPLTLAFAGAKAHEIPAWEQEARDHWSGYYLHYVEQYSDDDLGEEIGGGKAGCREKLWDESKNIQYTSGWCLQHRPEKAVRLVERITTFLPDEGEWSARRELCKEAMKIATTPESRAGVRHNLPRRPYIRLVGRDEQLDEVMQRLAPESRHWLVPIEGVGGVGKIALALEVGWRFVEGYDRLPPGRRFDIVIRASAKREVLTTCDIEPYRPTFTNLDDIVLLNAESLEIASKIGQEDGILLAKAGLADLMQENGDYQSAKQAYRELLPEYQKAHPRLQYILRQLGEIAIIERQFDEAHIYMEDAERALRLYYQADADARLQENWGDLEKALDCFDQARKAYKKALGLAFPLGMGVEINRLEKKLHDLDECQ